MRFLCLCLSMMFCSSGFAAIVQVNTTAPYVMLVSKDKTNFPVVLVSPGGVGYNDATFAYFEGDTLTDCILQVLLSGRNGTAFVDNTHLIEQVPNEMRGVRIVRISSVGYIEEDNGGVSPSYAKAFPRGLKLGFTKTVPVGATRPVRMSPWVRVAIQKPLLFDELGESVDPALIKLREANMVFLVAKGPGKARTLTSSVKALTRTTDTGISDYGQFIGQKTAASGIFYVSGLAAQRVVVNLSDPISEVAKKQGFVDGSAVDLVFDDVKGTSTKSLEQSAAFSATNYMVLEWDVPQ